MSETKTIPRFHPRTHHSLPYYNSVLQGLVQGLTSRKTDKEIADQLTATGILAPSGKQWTATAVSSALFKLRNFRTHPNRLHQALLQLIFEGFLKASQVGILFEPRSKPVM